MAGLVQNKIMVLGGLGGDNGGIGEQAWFEEEFHSCMLAKLEIQ